MSRKTVELGVLCFTSERDKLQLSVCAFAEFRFPESFSATTDKDIIRELATGGLWVSRGAGCRLDFLLSIDGKGAEGSQAFQLIEAIAYRLRNAPLWGQLSLSVSITTNHAPPFGETNSQISIALNLGPVDDRIAGSEIHLSVDLRPPESVQCAEFMGLRIHCNVSRSQIQTGELNKIPSSPPVTPLPRRLLGQHAHDEKVSGTTLETPVSPKIEKAPATTKKRKKPLPKTPPSKEIMLLDQNLENTPHSISSSKSPDDDLSKLFNNIAESFGIPKKRKLAPSRKLAKSKTSMHGPEQLMKREIPEFSLSSAIAPTHTPIKKLQKPVQATLTSTPTPKAISKKGTLATARNQNHDLLKMWIGQNQANTYPSRVQMQELLTATGYTRGYVSSLLGKFRTAVAGKVTKTEPNESLPLSLPSPLPPPSRFKLAINVELDDEMLLDDNDDAPYDFQDDDMLLDPFDDSLPWFVSELSPISSKPTTPSCTAYYELEPQEPTHPVVNLTTKIPVPPVCQLFETALRFLVGGGQRRRRGVKATHTNPETSLSLLTPSLFDRGFKKLMAQNARFIPTIISTMSVSLVKNKQGVGLRKKLFLIAYAARESDQLQSDAGTINLGRKMKMKDVVERRLWSMMHRKLYDAHTARNLHHTSADGIKNRPVFEGDEDILAGMNYNSQDSQQTISDAEEFDSLLGYRTNHSNDGLHDDNLLDDNSSIIFDDEDEEFEDLFHQTSEDDEGLISYLDEIEAERERREIERETDEMLLGYFQGGDESDEHILLDGLYHEKSFMAENEEVGFAREGRSLSELVGIGWR